MKLHGVCHALFAYDVGLGINLADCARRMKDATEPAWILHKRRAPSYFQFAPAPLRVKQTAPPAAVSGRATRGEVDCVLYDFGAVSVAYEIPFDGPLSSLVELSCALSEEAALREDSLRRVQGLVATAGDAVRGGNLAPLVEDYLIFVVESIEPALAVEEIVLSHGQEIARVLRAERGELSPEEVKDALSARISFRSDDLLFVDWNGAFILDREPEDAMAVLEFANVQLLEMRFLDDQLDASLDRTYETITARKMRRAALPGPSRIDLQRVARLQVDGAILYERVSNALKLLGDQYLARVYRLAANRFHLGEWNAGILRKLETIESIYQKMFDRAASRRMEMIEWLVVILIALSMILPFL